MKIGKLSLVICTVQTFGRFLFLHGNTRSVDFGRPNSAGNDDLLDDDNGIDFNVKPARLLAFVPFTPPPPPPPPYPRRTPLPKAIADANRVGTVFRSLCVHLPRCTSNIRHRHQPTTPSNIGRQRYIVVIPPFVFI